MFTRNVLYDLAFIISKVCSIKFRRKQSIALILCFLRNLIEQTLNTQNIEADSIKTPSCFKKESNRCFYANYSMQRYFVFLFIGLQFSELGFQIHTDSYFQIENHISKSQYALEEILVINSE